MDSDDRAILLGLQHQLDQIKARLARLERALENRPAVAK